MTRMAVVLGSTVTGFSSGAGSGFALFHSSIIVAAEAAGAPATATRPKIPANTNPIFILFLLRNLLFVSVAAISAASRCAGGCQTNTRPRPLFRPAIAKRPMRRFGASHGTALAASIGRQLHEAHAGMLGDAAPEDPVRIVRIDFDPAHIRLGLRQ